MAGNEAVAGLVESGETGPRGLVGERRCRIHEVKDCWIRHKGEGRGISDSRVGGLGALGWAGAVGRAAWVNPPKVSKGRV